MDADSVRLAFMTDEMYRSYFREYENDPDLCLPGQAYVPYVYSEEKVDRYIRKQRGLHRVTLAILRGEEIVGEIIIKDMEAHTSATMSIALKNAGYKDRGIGTRAERLAVRYVFDELDIPTLYADTIQTNLRSQHVLEKAGFVLVREDGEFKYYRIDRDDTRENETRLPGSPN